MLTGEYEVHWCKLYKIAKKTFWKWWYAQFLCCLFLAHTFGKPFHEFQHIAFMLQNTVDKLVQRANASILIGTSSWKEQFIEAITVSPGKFLRRPNAATRNMGINIFAVKESRFGVMKFLSPPSLCRKAYCCIICSRKYCGKFERECCGQKQRRWFVWSWVPECFCN